MIPPNLILVVDAVDASVLLRYCCHSPMCLKLKWTS